MTNYFLIIASAIIWLFCVDTAPQGLCPAGFSCSKAIQKNKVRNIDNGYFPEPCPAGTYSELGRDECVPCEPGFYANSSGTASCTVCPPGFRCSEPEKNPVPCPLGTHAACTGQTCCSSCPQGTYTPRVGSIVCINCPPGLRCPTNPTTMCGGDLLSPENQAILTKFTGRTNLKWKLLYKATRDGFRGQDFHRLCDGHPQTMNIIKSKNGYLFGGYAHTAWNSSNTYTNDPRAFLFTLVNPNSIQPMRYLVRGGSEHSAFYNYGIYGPTFGGGHDIFVSGASPNATSYINFPFSYSDTTGMGSRTFTGNYTYVVADVEVYRLLG